MPDAYSFEVAEITGSELAGVPEVQDVQDSSLETLRCAVAALLHTVRRISQENPQDAQEYLLHAAALLRLHPSSTPVGADASEPTAAAEHTQRGGLAPWQVPKLTTYIELHLDSAIVAADLAALAKLSTFHFCRAFRASFGESPHRYVMRRRIERAQGLMLQTNLSLAQIAIQCGLADQAHLNKSFRRFVGERPGAWRRARTVAPP